MVPRLWFASLQRAALAALLLGVLVSLTLSPATSSVAGPVEKVYWIDDTTFSSFVVDDSIMRSNLDGSGAEVILSEEMDAEFAIPSLAVHSPSGRIYWTNANTNEIKRADFDGSNIEVIAQTVVNPLGIAVDPVGEKVYWSTSELFLTASTIERADLDGSNRELILTPSSATYALAVDPVGGHLYYGSANEVLRANLDGTAATSLFIAPKTPGSNKFISFIVDLAVDPAGPDVYYTSFGVGGEVCFPTPGGPACTTFDLSSEAGRRLDDGSIERFSVAAAIAGGIAVAPSVSAVFTNHQQGVTRSDLDFANSAQIVAPAVAGSVIDLEIGSAEAGLPPTATPPPSVGGLAIGSEIEMLALSEDGSGQRTELFVAAGLAALAVATGAAWHSRKRAG